MATNWNRKLLILSLFFFLEKLVRQRTYLIEHTIDINIHHKANIA